MHFTAHCQCDVGCERALAVGLQQIRAVLFLHPPQKKTRCPGTLWGVSFNPPPLLMMLNRLCVMTTTTNRHAVKLSTPTYFSTIQTLESPGYRLLT
jgi:hypothetical protein